MNKKSLFRKTGKFASVTAGLSSALLPAFTVKAEDFEVSEDKNINDAFNNNWLSYVYYVFRFDFFRDYILSKVTKELATKLVTRNVGTIKGLTRTNSVFEFAFGKKGESLKYGFNLCEGLIKNTDMVQEYQWVNKILICSNFKDLNMTMRETANIVFGRNEYEKSKKAIELIKKISLYCDFFNYLINKFKEPSFKQYGQESKGFFFEFNSPIDLGDKGNCISLAFNFYQDHPSLIITCSGKGDFADNEGNSLGLKAQPVLYSCEKKDSTSLEEMVGIVKNIKGEIGKSNVNLKIYDKSCLEKVKRINRGEVVEMSELGSKN